MEGGDGAGHVLLGIALTTGVAAVVKLWGAWRQGRRESRADAIGEWRELLKQREEHAERLEAVIRQDQQAIEALQRENADCREEAAEMRSSQYFLYELLKRHHALLVSLGHDLGDLPALPSLRPRGHEADFLARQAAASAQLSQEAGQKLSPPPEAK